MELFKEYIDLVNFYDKNPTQPKTQNEFVNICYLPEFYSKFGLKTKNQKLALSSKHLYTMQVSKEEGYYKESSDTHYHNLKKTIMLKIPELLEDPDFVFYEQSYNDKNLNNIPSSLVIILNQKTYKINKETKESQKEVLVAYLKEPENPNSEITLLATSFNRPRIEKYINNLIKENRLLYLNEKRSLSSAYPGIQFPNISTMAFFGSLDLNIKQYRENVNLKRMKNSGLFLEFIPENEKSKIVCNMAFSENPVSVKFFPLDLQKNTYINRVFETLNKEAIQSIPEEYFTDSLKYFLENTEKCNHQSKIIYRTILNRLSDSQKLILFNEINKKQEPSEKEIINKMEEWSNGNFYSKLSMSKIPQNIQTISDSILSFEENQNTILDVIGKTISRDKDGKITEQSLKDISKTMSVYSDKHYETARYLFVKNGRITRHIAVSSQTPSSTVVKPDDKFLFELYDYAKETNSQIVFLHNHPSGYVEPSNADIELTNYLNNFFNSQGENIFAGHIILDHSNFGLYTPKEYWKALINDEIKPMKEIEKNYQIQLSKHKKKVLLNQDASINTVSLKELSQYAKECDAGELWNKDSWITGFILSGNGIVTSLEYFNKNEFSNPETLNDKLKTIGRKYGSENVILFPNNFEQFLICEQYAQNTRKIKEIYLENQDGTFERSNFSNGNIFNDVSLSDVKIEDTNDFSKEEIEKQIEKNVNNEKKISKFDEELIKIKNNELDASHVFDLGKPSEILVNCGFPKHQKIELKAKRLLDKSNQQNHPFDIEDVKGLDKAIKNPIAVFEYGNREKSQNVIVNLEKDGKNFLVGVFFNQNRDGYEVSSIRGLFNRDNIDWIRWIEQGRMIYGNKNQIQVLIAQQRTNLADVNKQDTRTSSDTYYLDSVDSLLSKFKNVNEIYTANFDFYKEQKSKNEIFKLFRNHYAQTDSIEFDDAKFHSEQFYKALENKNYETLLKYTSFEDNYEIGNLTRNLICKKMGIENINNEQELIFQLEKFTNKNILKENKTMAENLKTNFEQNENEISQPLQDDVLNESIIEKENIIDKSQDSSQPEIEYEVYDEDISNSQKEVLQEEEFSQSEEIDEKKKKVKQEEILEEQEQNSSPQFVTIDKFNEAISAMKKMQEMYELQAKENAELRKQISVMQEQIKNQSHDNSIEANDSISQNNNNANAPKKVIPSEYRKNSYQINSDVPKFGHKKEDGTIEVIKGGKFHKLIEDDLYPENNKVVIALTNEDGTRRELEISEQRYEQIIGAYDRLETNKKEMANDSYGWHKAHQDFRKTLDLDKYQYRMNTTDDFVHNFKVHCFREVTNLDEAFEIARQMVNNMPPNERIKFNQFRKTQFPEGKEKAFDEMLIKTCRDILEEKKQDANINLSKEFSIIDEYNKDNFFLKQGELIPGTNKKVGDIIPMSITTTTFNGVKRVDEKSDYTLAEVARDFNPQIAILVDTKTKAKYQLPLKDVVKHIQKIEKTIAKENRKQKIKDKEYTFSR